MLKKLALRPRGQNMMSLIILLILLDSEPSGDLILVAHPLKAYITVNMYELASN